MKSLFLFLMTLVSISTFAQEKQAVIDPNAQKRVLNAPFNAITVSDGIEIYLTQGNEESIAVSASDEKYMAQFKTVVESGTLKIYYDNSGIHWGLNDKRKLKAYISFKSINKIQASGGAFVTLEGMSQFNALDMKFTAGSYFTGNMKAVDLTVEQNSGSEINITGRADKIKVTVSSGATFKGYDLATDYCDAQATSGAGVRITVNKELSAKATTGGGIRYKGSGVIRDVNIHTGGVVKKA